MNGKISIATELSQPDQYKATGSIAVPLGYRFGLQADVGYSDNEIDGLGNVAAPSAGVHLFWRDPSQGRLGLYGEWLHLNAEGGSDFQLGGFDAEKYWDRVTLAAFVGASDGDLVDTQFVSRASFAYYPTDDLQLQIGHLHILDSHTLFVGGEWAIKPIEAAATSLYLDASLHEGGDTSVMLGLRLYLGKKNRTLIQRHREDDPQSILVSNSVFHIEGLLARYNLPH